MALSQLSICQKGLHITFFHLPLSGVLSFHLGQSHGHRAEVAGEALVHQCTLCLPCSWLHLVRVSF